MNKRIKLSVVIPAFNEEIIVKDTLDEVTKFLSKKNYTWEVIVVDDGSTDNTAEIVNNLKSLKLKLIKSEKNKGKGSALKLGVEKAKGEIILFTDMDLSVPIKFTDKVIKELDSGYDLAIGSRRIEGSKILIHQPLLRESMGRVYTKLSQIILQTKTTDFTCGFKGFKKLPAKNIFRKSRITGWAFDSEIIFLAKKYKYSVSEVPVHWKNRQDTRVKIGAATINSFIDLFKIRFFSLRGVYD